MGGLEGGDSMEKGWEMREGWVDGDPEVVDSTRAELMGVVGAMRGLWEVWGQSGGAVVHRLDNESVVKVMGRVIHKKSTN